MPAVQKRITIYFDNISSLPQAYDNNIIKCLSLFLRLIHCRRTINLHSYCPMNELTRKSKYFNTAYDGATTMCAFNVDKAMVFKNDTFEYYSVDNDFFIDSKTQLDSFHSNYLFSVPIYINKT